MKEYYLNPNTHLMTERKYPHIVIPGIRELRIYEVRQIPKTNTIKPINKTNMNLLNKMLNRIGDKGVHYTVCLIYAYIITLVILFTTNGNYLASSLSGIYAGTGIGIGKEYGDAKAHGNCWSWGDILADELGTISGTALACLTYYLIALWK